MTKNDLQRLILVSMFVWSAAESVRADQIVYQNYFVGGLGSYRIGHPPDFPGIPAPAVSDSFVITSSASLTEAVTYFWVHPGDSPTTVDWEVGTTPFSQDISSGTSSITSTYYEKDAYGIDSVFRSTFAINGTIEPGTYYLTLTNGYSVYDSYPAPPHSPPQYGDLMWDISYGPATVEIRNQGFNIPVSGSNSFKLYGNPVPEPSTFVLLGCGCLGIAIHALRHRRSA